MRRVSALVFLLLATLAAPTAAHAQGAFIMQTSQRLGKLIEVENKAGYELKPYGISGGMVRQSENDWVGLFDMTLEQDLPYLFVATGDEDARDIDLRVLDRSGKVVAADVEVSREPHARVAYRPAVSGVHTVEIRLYASERNQPCVCIGAVLAKADANAGTYGAAVMQSARRLGPLVDAAGKNAYKMMHMGIDGGLLRQAPDRWVDLFTRTLERNIEYLIVAAADDDARDIDLEIRDENGRQVAIDPDSSRESSAAVAFRPSATGRYSVRIRLFASDRNLPCAFMAATMVRSAANVPDPVGNSVAPNATRVFEVKEATPLTIDGELKLSDASDPRRRDCRAHVHRIKLERAKTYVIDLASRQFDSFLRLENAQGTQLAEDDDGGGGLNSRLEFTPNAEGEFRIITTTVPENAQGRYTLTVRLKE